MEGLLNKLAEGFDRYEIPYVVTSNIEGYAFVVKFIGVDKGNDCFLLLVALANEIRLHQLIGTRKTRHLFHDKDISEDFFVIIKTHYETVKRYVDLDKQMCPEAPHQINKQDVSTIIERRENMQWKKNLIVLVFGGVLIMASSCTSTGYNTQKGAAIGAAVGALAGQVIGNDTASTLIGAAGGALGGAIVGNAIDQNEVEGKFEDAQRQSAVTASVSPEDQPPGQWIEIPGQWKDGKWVPAHRVWVPVNPNPTASR